MTNREAFNKYIREDALKKVEHVEQMDTERMVDTPREFKIVVRVHDMLCVYKINSTGKSIGKARDVVDWLNSERTDEEELRWQASVAWNREREARTN